MHKPFRWESFDATDRRFRLLVSAAAPHPGGQDEPAFFIVRGRVSLGSGEPASRLFVRAFEQDLRGAVPLGEAQTAEDGQDEIRYDGLAADDDGEKGGPDPHLRVHRTTGAELPATVTSRDVPSIGDRQILFNAGPEPSRIVGSWETLQLG